MDSKTLLTGMLLFASLSAFSQGTATADSVSDSNHEIVFTKAETGPSFWGGDHEWIKFISGQMVKNLDQLTGKKNSGTLHIRFIVDQEGKVSDITALNMQGSRLAKVITEALAKGPEWIPAVQNKRLVKAYKEVSVTFKSE